MSEHRVNAYLTARVGVDLASIAEVARSIDRFGDRYTRRLFTEHEMSCGGSTKETMAASLAARFAAKEATMKVLRPSGIQTDWRSIEVVQHPDGWCGIQLTGAAARLADQAGIEDLGVSMTHEGKIAAAVVMALCEKNKKANREQP